MKTSFPKSLVAHRKRPDAALGLGLLLISMVGLLHIWFGKWQSGPGVGSWLIPLIAYLCMALAAIVILWSPLAEISENDETEADVRWPVVVAAAWAILFFLTVLNIGLMVGTFAAVLLATWCLTPRDQQAWLPILFTSSLAAVGFWFIFGFLARIIV
jgi:hypothetical protein